MKILRGHTLMELVLVLALVAILSVPLGLSVATIRSKQALEAEADKFLTAVKQTHIYAREGKDEASWGIRGTGANSYSMWSKSAASGTVAKTEFVIDGQVSFQTNTPFEVWFNQGTGYPKTGTTQTVIIKTNGAVNNSKTIRISPVGVIEIQ